MSSPDLQALWARAREVQERLAEVQRDLARRTVEGSAGGGLVVAVARGDLRILRVTLDPDLLAKGDRELVQDLVAAAVNAALTNAQRMAEEELRQIAGFSGPLPLLGNRPSG